jgi:hypothetical protein
MRCSLFLEAFCAFPIFFGSPETWADCPFFEYATAERVSPGISVGKKGLALTERFMFMLMGRQKCPSGKGQLHLVRQVEEALLQLVEEILFFRRERAVLDKIKGSRRNALQVVVAGALDAARSRIKTSQIREVMMGKILDVARGKRERSKALVPENGLTFRLARGEVLLRFGRSSHDVVHHANLSLKLLCRSGTSVG